MVTLSSDDTSEATVPSTVTILDGQSSATFDIAAVDDSAADGTQTVTVAVSASGYAGGSDTLDVTDDEASLVTILDDGESGFTQSGFSEQSNSQVAAAYDGDNHNMRGGTGYGELDLYGSGLMGSIRWLRPGPINTTTSTTRSMRLSRSPTAAALSWPAPRWINRMPRARLRMEVTAGIRSVR